MARRRPLIFQLDCEKIRKLSAAGIFAAEHSSPAGEQVHGRAEVRLNVLREDSPLGFMAGPAPLYELLVLVTDIGVQKRPLRAVLILFPLPLMLLRTSRPEHGLHSKASRVGMGILAP